MGMRLKYVKLIRKYSLDIWDFIKYRRKVNKFSNYYKDLILIRLEKLVGKKRLVMNQLQKNQKNISKLRKTREITNVLDERKKAINFFGLSVIRKVVRLPKRFKSSFGRLLVFRKSLFYFYGGLSLYKAKQIVKRSSKTLNPLENFVNCLESQLCVVVYRMNFVRTVNEGKYLIKNGVFLVNKVVIKDPRFFLKPGDIVEVGDSFKKLILFRIQKIIVKNGFYMLYPRNVEVDYRLLVGLYTNYPEKNEIFYPFKVSAEFYSRLYYGRF